MTAVNDGDLRATLSHNLCFLTYIIMLLKQPAIKLLISSFSHD